MMGAHDPETLIRASWQQLEPVADELVARFYERLFQLNPGARVLFAHSDHAATRRLFAAALGEIVRLAGDADRLVRTAAALGRRHAAYGVEARDYEDAAAAFVRALHDTLGARLTDDTAEAWRALFHTLSGVMQRAARMAGDVAPRLPDGAAASAPRHRAPDTRGLPG